MQTFLPFPDFGLSIACLDYRRLGKQRVEAFQLLVANGDKWALSERQWRIEQGLMEDKPLRKGWRNHPAAIMWQYYTDALRTYYNLAIEEWIRRGYNNTMRLAPRASCIEIPHWLGNGHLHASHRSNLLRKDPDYYERYGWSEEPGLEYFWPKND